jgi:carbon monoxide dehydrogenase subunit G
MRIDKEVKVEVSPDLAWEEFLDVADLIGCVPGAQMEALGDGVYRGAIDAAINGSRIACSATVRPIDADLDERQASFRIRGRETGGLAIGGGIVGGRVVPDNGAARVVLSADLEIVGHGTDQRSVEAGANELLHRFAERLSARIVERASHAGEREAEPGPQRAEAGAPKPASALGRLTPRHGIALGAIALLVALLLALTGRRRSISVSLRYRW